MNKFLKNLVALNQTIVENAQTQFIGFPTEPNNVSLASLMSSEEQLTAAVIEEYVSGEIRYGISTEGNSEGWKMSVSFNLNQQPEEIPYVSLSFTKQNTNQEDDFLFQEVSIVDSTTNEYKAVLDLQQLTERDNLLYALSDYASQTTLVVTIRENGIPTNIVVNPKTFFFAPNIYAYIYAGILPPPPVQAFKIQYYIYDNITYSYFQDANTTRNLFYTADTYELGHDESTGLPTFSIRFDTTGEEEIKTTFEFLLVPKVIKERIEQALIDFKNMEPDGQLLPLNSATSLQFNLQLPSGNILQSNAIIDLQSGVIDAFTVNFEDTLIIWDALFNKSPMSLLLKGQLQVNLEGFNSVQLPIKLSLPNEYNTDDYFEKFVDKSYRHTVSKTVEFISTSGVYEDSNKPVESILVLIDNQTLELTKEQPTCKVTVQVPIVDILRGDLNKIIYHYKYTVRYKTHGEETFIKQSQYTMIYVPN